jgi:serine/threonine protein phosphatase PrpC
MERKVKKKTRKEVNGVSDKVQVKSCGQFTMQGYNSENLNKVNQDTGFCVDTPNGLVFGVADGHGHYGELVSQYIGSVLNRLSLSSISAFYLYVHDSLTSQGIDSRYSGSTLSIACLNDKLIVSNVGDSHVILGYTSNVKGKQKWEAKLLSKIHTPDSREEAQRISQNGGRITKGQPSRVWLRNEDIPGLAITRSIGDSITTPIGVIPDPDITVYDLDPSYKWVLVCSDGVTDVLDYSEISKIISRLWKQNQAQTACEKLSKAAREKWVGNIIDDITCVCVFFEVV